MIFNLFKKKDVWKDYGVYIRELEQKTLNAFQQSTRKESIVNITKEEGFFQ